MEGGTWKLLGGTNMHLEALTTEGSLRHHVKVKEKVFG